MKFLIQKILDVASRIPQAKPDADTINLSSSNNTNNSKTTGKKENTTQEGCCG